MQTLCALFLLSVNFLGFPVQCKKHQPNSGEIMPGRIQQTLIESVVTAGTAIFYAQDFRTFTLGLFASTGTSPVAAYSVKLYATPTTPDAAAFTYKTQGAGAVAVFENVTDTDGTPYNFYKMVVSYSGLTNSEADGSAVFTAVISAS